MRLDTDAALGLMLDGEWWQTPRYKLLMEIESLRRMSERLRQGPSLRKWHRKAIIEGLRTRGCRIAMLESLLEEIAGDFDPPPPHWMPSPYGTGETYCYTCGLAAWRHLRKRHKDCRDELDGGWSQESDSSIICAACGKLLDYTLDDYGVEEEVEHFRRSGPITSQQEAYEMLRVLGAGGFDFAGSYPQHVAAVKTIALRQYIHDVIDNVIDQAPEANPETSAPSASSAVNR